LPLITSIVYGLVDLSISQSINIRLLHGCQTATIVRHTMKSTHVCGNNA